MAVVEAPLDSYPQTYGDDAPSGFPGNVNPEQKAALEKLRKELEEEGYTQRLDEPSLLRFLRARRFDVEKSKEMFINCEKWRKDFGTDTIIEDFHYIEKVEVSKYYPQYYHKTDKDGRPVYVEQLGSVDLKQMYKITTMDRMIKNLVWEYETFTKYRLPACSRKAGKLVETSCTIMDLKGVGISQVSQVYHYVREASTIGQNYYPERMGKFYLINAPFGFSTAFRLIRPLLDPVTVEKIFILSSSYKTELLKQVGPENLPKKFGGACQCPEGCELSDAGPWHDKEYIGPEGEAMSAAEYAKKYTEEHPEEAKAEMMATAAAAMNHAH